MLRPIRGTEKCSKQPWPTWRSRSPRWTAKRPNQSCNTMQIPVRPPLPASPRPAYVLFTRPENLPFPGLKNSGGFMKKVLGFVAVAVVCGLALLLNLRVCQAASPGGQQKAEGSTGDDGSTALTIYNQNFFVAREHVPLDLKAGVNEAQYAGVAAHLEPDSVILRDPNG